MNYANKTIEAYEKNFDQYVKRRLGTETNSIKLLEKFKTLLPGKNILEIGFDLGFDAERMRI